MGITVEFNSYEEMVDFANKLVGTKVKADKVGTSTGITDGAITRTNKAEETVQEETTVQEEALAGEEEKAYTLEEVRAALAVLTRNGKQKEVKDLLASFNAKNLSGVDEKNYAALMEKAGAL